MIAFLLGLAVLGADPADPVLLIPEGASSTAIQFLVSMGDQPADQVWVEFLRQWQTLFDTSRDHQLNLAEAECVPALTNATGSPIRLDLQAADTNGDDQVSHEELQAFYRTRGVQGINAVPATQDLEAIQTGQTLWELLDHNRDGRLSSNELESAEQLLNRWDLNEDERLTPLELTAQTTSIERQSFPPINWSSEQVVREKTLAVPLRLNSLKVTDVVERELPSGIERVDGVRLRLRRSSTTVVVQFAESSTHRITAAQQYLLGEINSARTDRTALDLAQIRSDPILDWLVPFMNAADADHDNHLSQSEITNVVNLLAKGAAAQVSIAVSIRGRNLFDCLDTNADNRLDLRELHAARNLIALRNVSAASAIPALPLTREDVPMSVVVDVRRGPIGGRFGRLRIARRSTELASPQLTPVGLPRWFTAMDRNRDQTISPFEFLGSIQRFEILDRNSDGIITSDEAVPAGADQPNR